MNLNPIFTVAGIWQAAQRMYLLAEKNQLQHFSLHLENLNDALERVEKCMKRQYGSWQKIPWHSRWLHVEGAPLELWKPIAAHYSTLSLADRKRAKLEMITLSVLLDGGAGSAWRYEEVAGKRRLGRSEGLAAASLDLYGSGALSQDRKKPFLVDATGLKNLNFSDFARAFQLRPDNPMPGVEERLDLLQRLGQKLEQEGGLHLGNWLEQHLNVFSQDERVSAEDLMNRLIALFRSLWTKGLKREEEIYGDVGFYSCARLQMEERFFPFHKLTLWLGYSLADTLRREGFQITDLERCPGLAEYRNGGLFVDCGVLLPKDPASFQQSHQPLDDFTIEWRALTLALLEELGTKLRAKWSCTDLDLPMARVLQAGTWMAGRELALQRRPDGSPPFFVDTQGVLF